MTINKIKLTKLKLKIDSLIIGERTKGGVFRPCQETIPSSSIEGALRNTFQIFAPAVGLLEKETYQKQMLAYTVKDRVFETSKVPLYSYYLAPMKSSYHDGFITGYVYLPHESLGEQIKSLHNSEFFLGAFKSKGFGKCEVVEIKTEEYSIKQGYLNVKLFQNELKDFGVQEISGLYGYMFRPDKDGIGGKYEISLFPKSLVLAPEIFLSNSKDRERVTYYDF